MVLISNEEREADKKFYGYSFVFNMGLCLFCITMSYGFTVATAEGVFFLFMSAFFAVLMVLNFKAVIEAYKHGINNYVVNRTK